jgi:hypothetical protein
MTDQTHIHHYHETPASSDLPTSARVVLFLSGLACLGFGVLPALLIAVVGAAEGNLELAASFTIAQAINPFAWMALVLPILALWGWRGGSRRRAPRGSRTTAHRAAARRARGRARR